MKNNLLKIFIIGLILIGGIASYLISSKYLLKKDSASSDTNIVENGEDIIFEGVEQAYYRTQDPEELFEISEIVLIGKYQRDVSTKMYDRDPCTSFEFKIETIFKNSNNRILNDTIIARSLGGVISLDEYLEARGNEFKEKLGINTMNPTELKTKKVKISLASNGDKSFEENPYRLLFINYDPQHDDFVIIAGRAGMPSYNEETKQIFDTNNQKNENVSFLQ